MSDFDEFGEYLKADLSVNGEKTEEVIKKQREKEKNLYPLRINKQTVIYVPLEKCNEEYRQEWIDKYIEKNIVVKDEKPKSPSQIKKPIDLEKVKMMFAEGHNGLEVCKMLMISTSLLCRRCKEAGISMPTNKSRSRILAEKGMSIEQISDILKLDPNTIRGYLK